MSSMDFTDEQIMQFVDGEATQDLANKIEKARENNKELKATIVVKPVYRHGQNILVIV